MAAMNAPCRSRAFLVGLVLFLIPWVVASFEILCASRCCPTIARGQGRRHSSSSTCVPPFRTQAQDTDAPIGEEDSIQRHDDEPSSSLSLSLTPPQRQHWLDLRGTAIRPDEALAFLDEFLFHNDKDSEDKGKKKEKEKEEEEESLRPSIANWIDCVIVPRDTFREISTRKVASKVNLLIVDEDDNDKQSNIVYEATGDIKGVFLSTDTSAFLNPLDSLDLYNKGDWILFESSDKVDSNNDTNELKAWVEQIGSLLQLLPATAVPESLQTPSGLILPPLQSSSTTTSHDDSAQTEPPVTMRNQGGVGICCPTRQSVFSIDALLEQVLSTASTIEAPESGILLLTKDASDVVEIPITSALILPFDLDLWRAVLELRQETRWSESAH